MSLSLATTSRTTQRPQLASVVATPGHADRLAELRQYIERIAQSFPNHLGGAILCLSLDGSAFEPADFWNFSETSRQRIQSFPVDALHAELIRQGTEVYLSARKRVNDRADPGAADADRAVAYIPIVVDQQLIGCLYTESLKPVLDLDDRALLFQLKEVTEQLLRPPAQI